MRDDLNFNREGRSLTLEFSDIKSDLYSSYFKGVLSFQVKKTSLFVCTEMTLTHILIKERKNNKLHDIKRLLYTGAD